MSVQARAAAYRDALAKAGQYAQLAGRRLELMSIVEEPGSAPVLYRTGAGADGGTIPVAAGEVVEAARVFTEFRLCCPPARSAELWPGERHPRSWRRGRPGAGDQPSPSG
ncbi:SIMPL domain-containing protein [Streptomyces lavendulae]